MSTKKAGIGESSELPRKWQCRAVIISPILRDGETIERKVVWDGFKKTLAIIENNNYLDGYVGELAINHFREIISAI